MRRNLAKTMGQARSAIGSRAASAHQKLTDGSVQTSGACVGYEVTFDAPATSVTAVFPLALADQIEDDNFVIELEPFNEIGHSVNASELNTSFSRLLQAPYVYVKNVNGTVKTQTINLDHHNISRIRMCLRVWKKLAGSVSLADLGPLLVSSTVESPKRTITKKATLR